MASRLRGEKAAQSTSSASKLKGQRSASSHAGTPDAAGASSTAAGPVLGDELIALTPHGLDQLEAELGTDPLHAHVHHVGAGIEVIAPDGGEQPALGHQVAGVLGELAQQQELKAGQ